MTSNEKRPIGPVDTIWLNMDRPNNLMVVSSVMFLDAVPDWDAVEELFRVRVLDRYPVFRQRPVPPRGPLGRPSWVDDEAFDLARHLHRVTLPSPGSDADLQGFVETRLHEPFDPRHPLWEVHLVDGHATGAALLCRTHHSLADGMALARVLLDLTDESPDEAGPPGAAADEDAVAAAGAEADAGAEVTPALDISADLRSALPPPVPVDPLDSPPRPFPASVPATVPSSVPSAVPSSVPSTDLLPIGALAATGVGLAAHLAELAWGTARQLGTRHGIASAADLALRTTQVAGQLLLSHNPENRLAGTPRVRKRVVWAQPVPIDALKHAGRLAGGTLNDVLMSAVAGALHTYQLDDHADPVDLITMVPVNVRPLDQPIPAELGNRFALVFFRYPSGLGSTLARLSETKRRMDWIKASPEAVLTYGLINLIGRTNRTLERYLVDFFANKAIGVTTNVIGPRSPRYLAGARVSGVLGWVPGSGRHTVGVCIFTYAGQVRVGFMTDASVVPHPERLLIAFEDELDRLSTLGGLDLDQHRRRTHAHRQRTPRADRPRTGRTRARHPEGRREPDALGAPDP